MTSKALEIRGLSKAFGPNVVLRGVSLTVKPGQILGLCGENGAGKSTLMRCMAGFLGEDAGSVVWGGENLPGGEARRRVCRLVPQEFHLVPGMTVAENLFLGRELQRGSFIDKSLENEEAMRVLAEAGAPALDPGAPVSALGVADRQKIEIARALLNRAPVLLFDEPTTVLGPEETEALLDVVRKFRDGGGAAMWVSHKLDEVLAVCDDIAVLRDGALVECRPAGDFTPESLAEAMVGRPLSHLYPPKAAPVEDSGRGPALEAVSLADGGRVKDASLTVRQGEILGIAGLAGSGRTELAHMLCGHSRPVRGKILLGGEEVRFSSVSDALARGVAYLTEDRQGEGILPDEPVAANIALSSLGLDAAGGVFLSSRRRDSRVLPLADALKIQRSKLSDPERSLSGGNQQKTVLARALAAAPRVLVVDEPTRGVDVGARAEIYAALRRLAADGMAIVAISSEMDEVVGLCDRVVVMHDGVSSAPLEGEAVNDRQIVRLAHGLTGTPAQ
ncbi:MAG: sugar ABC transporter ATP-binding protein [Kiritimatiellae bacterium]|nr:sugar ABC transporter ATP-binding protein [Kiritimatiellia bacterium]